jgi:hypothetical protein
VKFVCVFRTFDELVAILLVHIVGHEKHVMCRPCYRSTFASHFQLRGAMYSSNKRAPAFRPLELGFSDFPVDGLA